MKLPHDLKLALCEILNSGLKSHPRKDIAGQAPKVYELQFVKKKL